MGGNALKNCKTRRYTAEEYHALKALITTKLITKLGLISRAQTIPAYRHKESFGDMDVLYSTYDDRPLTVDDVKYVFPDSKEIIRNTDTISFEYNELQIDLIHSKSVSFDYAYSYFSWNDLGNLIGRIAHKFGLKHGHRGLTLPLRDGDNLFDEVVLTYDHSRALQFLGFDSTHFSNGFDSLEQIYNYVVCNKYFNPEIYKLENLNTIARTRDKKRPTYNGFLKFCSDIDANQCYQYEKDKTTYLSKIFSMFPECIPTFNDIMKEIALQKLVKEKFNGNIVSEYTSLKDKELGYFMKYLRNKVEFDSGFIVYLNDKQIQKNIMKYLEDFNNEKI